MSRYLDAWDAILRPFGRIAWRNPNYLFGVQVMPNPAHRPIRRENNG